jgi:hypothetical protein
MHLSVDEGSGSGDRCTRRQPPAVTKRAIGAAPIAAVPGERMATSSEQTPAALWVAEMLGSEKNRCVFFDGLFHVVGRERTRLPSVAGTISGTVLGTIGSA